MFQKSILQVSIKWKSGRLHESFGCWFEQKPCIRPWRWLDPDTLIQKSPPCQQSYLSSPNVATFNTQRAKNGIIHARQLFINAGCLCLKQDWGICNHRCIKRSVSI